ncbi:expressed unknown protein [Seminavis robusta]|uniref:Uncharacterized protein n=1 Tax=Seminavis robusta TaxID=568900 RepID=A0A9N8ESN3_9STRA|nr:expressed unknown protein [Seminavis robusta]|eukprot:Sro1712_g292920.1 n/a (259) ;mRNA; f:14979-15755
MMLRTSLVIVLLAAWIVPHTDATIRGGQEAQNKREAVSRNARHLMKDNNKKNNGANSATGGTSSFWVTPGATQGGAAPDLSSASVGSVVVHHSNGQSDRTEPGTSSSAINVNPPSVTGSTTTSTTTTATTTAVTTGNSWGYPNVPGVGANGSELGSPSIGGVQVVGPDGTVTQSIGNTDRVDPSAQASTNTIAVAPNNGDKGKGKGKDKNKNKNQNSREGSSDSASFWVTPVNPGLGQAAPDLSSASVNSVTVTSRTP